MIPELSGFYASGRLGDKGKFVYRDQFTLGRLGLDYVYGVVGHGDRVTKGSPRDPVSVLPPTNFRFRNQREAGPRARPRCKPWIQARRGPSLEGRKNGHRVPWRTFRHSITVTDYTVNVIQAQATQGKLIPVTELSLVPLTGLTR